MSEIFTIGCHLSTSKGFLNMGKEFDEVDAIVKSM